MTTVELHTSPPCYGQRASDPHCLAAQKALELSGVAYDLVGECSNDVVVPNLVVFGDVCEKPTLNECTADTPSRSFDAIISFIEDNGAYQGPIKTTHQLNARSRAQGVAYRTLLESNLLPSLQWVRCNKHRALHRREMSNSVGWLKRSWSSANSFSVKEKMQMRKVRSVVKSDKDAVCLAMDGYNTIATILKSSSTEYMLGTTEPTLLDVLTWGMLVAHKTQPCLNIELAKYRIIETFLQTMSKEEITPPLQLRPLATAEETTDPHAEGRIPAALFMTSVFFYHLLNNSEILQASGPLFLAGLRTLRGFAQQSLQRLNDKL
eukprot:TRINITY_DN6889_c0_g1_i1.p1 TRINITY_DN6889_c0_g1~~TRINITY_DN6889_c0_g1_i1.p1  ORF type:complete len:321 (+),score=42.94 TRINITY_DN6889_c0_g1_i1:37-999(+)